MLKHFSAHDLIHFRRFAEASNRILDNEIVIAAALRTPIARYPSHKPTDLCNMVIDGVIKRATIPRTEIRKLIISTNLAKEEHEAQAMTRTAATAAGLKMCTCYAFTSTNSTDMDKVQLALQTDTNTSCIIIGDLRTHSEHMTHDNGTSRNAKASQAGIFDEEILPVNIQQKRQPLVTVKMDDFCGEDSSGAAALVLINFKKAQIMGLQPLARFVDFQLIHSTDTVTDFEDALKNLLSRQNLSAEQIAMWEISSFLAKNCEAKSIIEKLSSDAAKLNMYGALNISTIHLLTHLVHALQPGNIGCAVAAEQNDGNSAVILIEKLGYTASTNKDLPQLTLYTKDNCPLCDTLVDELETRFAGQFLLRKVFIDKKENVRFLRLYRHDIPVLFLNGQFLCMHKLNIPLLERKFELLKKQNCE